VPHTQITPSSIARFRTLQDMAGRTICTTEGTTTLLNIADAFESRGIEYEVLLNADYLASFQDFLEGRCDVYTTDRSGLAGLRMTVDDPDSLTILDFVLSKEPLGPLSLDNDPQFADIIRWTIYGMIQAEELGIDSENLDDFLDSNNPNVQRLLGLNDTPSGIYMGIPNDFMVTVLRQVGNYGEVYQRHLNPIGLEERGLNDLWTRGGLLYSPPFR
jgi:general L-amino acid transport system substrate-binding protein